MMQIMPFDDAKTYRFNPFDLTKVWPHTDYPLIEVGRLTLDRNPTDHHSQIEQGAWEPSNLVPASARAPTRCCWPHVRLRRRPPLPHRRQLQPAAGQRTSIAGAQYSTAGDMRYQLATDPVYAPNSKGGPHAATERYGEPAGWQTDGEMVRTAYTLRSQDDDWGQARTLVREVFDDGERNGWSTTSSAPAQRSDRTVLQRASNTSQRRPRPRRTNREGRARGLSGPGGRPDDPPPSPGTVGDLRGRTLHRDHRGPRQEGALRVPRQSPESSFRTPRSKPLPNWSSMPTTTCYSSTRGGCTCGACSSHAGAGIRRTPNSPTSAPCFTISV